ncbi:MAG: enoyl-CoA hydratase/isomerase family protein [Desulfurococcales archaeon]|nr:enoyl-CoA hydratase/isomerase family protein [Desulfurococcales archaeon]
MPIRVERWEHVSWVIIDREDKGNSLDYEHARQLADIIRRECEEPSTAVVALRGAGSRFFSTGVDLESVANVRGAEDAMRLMGEGLGGVCKAITGCSKPFIAAVNGHAVGIGFEMVVASDLAFAVRGVKMGSPAVKWGMVPPASTTIGQYIMGQKSAAYIVLTGELLPSDELYRMGLLNGLVDSVEELVSMVEGVAAKIAGNSRWAVREAVRVMRASRMHHLTEIGLRSLILSTARPEAAERARGFLERKR